MTKEMEKKLEENLDLFNKTNCLVTTNQGYQEVFRNLGDLMDTLTFEGVQVMKEGKSLEVTEIRPIVNKEKGYVIFYVKYLYGDTEKDLDIQTKMLTDHQISEFCEHLKKAGRFKKN